MSFFGELEQIAADLYPYRWPITIGLVVATAVAVWFAYRRGWHLIALRHKLASAAIAIVALAIVVPTGNYVLSPLWERSFLEEASPLAFAGSDPTPAEQPPPVEQQPPADGTALEPRVVADGEFSGADSFHFGEGRALLIETGPDQYTLRFEEFSVRNGPDLFVYLSPGEDENGALNLGELKATDGAFNYEIPAGTDVAQFRYAIVWCQRFAVLFASAPLEQT